MEEKGSSQTDRRKPQVNRKEFSDSSSLLVVNNNKMKRVESGDRGGDGEERKREKHEKRVEMSCKSEESNIY